MSQTNIKSDQIHFVGHACFWITLDGHDFIIDANFSQKIFSFLKRHSSVGIDVHHLPDVSALVVTHAHYDHLDLFTYKYFSLEKPILVPTGVGAFVRRFLNNPIHELKSGQSLHFGSVKITAVTTRHTGARLSYLRYTHCNGYVFEGSKTTIYMPGDSAYGPHFAEIGKNFKVAIACLPIGPLRPEWLMRRQHLNPAEAVKAFEDLGAETLIPYKWEGFELGLDKKQEALDLFQKEIKAAGLEKSCVILNPGESHPLENRKLLKIANP